MFYKLQLNKRLAESEAQKLKEVDDFKNVFYQNITHEFRTPLTVILGLTENLKDKTSSTIKRNAKQLLKLVNELLSKMLSNDDDQGPKIVCSNNNTANDNNNEQGEEERRTAKC